MVLKQLDYIVRGCYKAIMNSKSFIAFMFVIFALYQLQMSREMVYMASQMSIFSGLSTLLRWLFFSCLGVIGTVYVLLSVWNRFTDYTVVPISYVYKRAKGLLLSASYMVAYSMSSEPEQADQVLKQLANQAEQHAFGLAAVMYSASRVRDWKDCVAELVKFLSMMNISKVNLKTVLAPKNPMAQQQSVVGVAEWVVNNFSDISNAKVGEQQSLDQAVTIAGTALALTGRDFTFDVNVEQLVWRASSNIKNYKTCWTEIKALLMRMGLLRDASYGAILDAARDIQSLKDDLDWVKTMLLLNPQELLFAAGKQRVTNMKQKSDELHRRLSNIDDRAVRNDSMFKESSALSKEIRDFLVKVDAMRASTAYRPKPVGVCIQGVGQIGKTIMVPVLVAKVGEALERRDPRFRGARRWQIWRRNVKDEFETGYCGQDVVYQDDAFQQKDDRDHLDWFTWISNCAVGTNQADIALKGLAFQARLVIVTCNVVPKSSTTVTTVSSLHARFPIGVYARPIPGTSPPDKTSGVIDPSYDWIDFKLSTMAELSGFSEEASRAHLASVSLDALADKIAEQIIYEENIYESMQTLLSPNAVEQISFADINEEGEEGIPVLYNEIAEHLSSDHEDDHPKLSNYEYARLYNDLKSLQHDGFKVATIDHLYPWVEKLREVSDGALDSLSGFDLYGFILAMSRVKDPKSVDAARSLPPVVLQLAGKKYVWVPWFQSGRTIIPLSETLKKLLASTDYTTYMGKQYNCMVDSSLITFIRELDLRPYTQFDEISRSACCKIVKKRVYGQVDLELKRRLFPEDSPTIITAFRKVIDQRFAKLDSMINKISESGLEVFFSICGYIGIPISEQWQATLMSKSTVIGATAVGLMTGFMLYFVMELLKQRSKCLEQSSDHNVKRVKITKLAKTVRRFDPNYAVQHADSDGAEIFDGVQKFDSDAVSEELLAMVEETSSGRVLFNTYSEPIKLDETTYENGCTLYLYEEAMSAPNPKTFDLDKCFCEINKLRTSDKPQGWGVEICYKKAVKVEDFSSTLTTFIDTVQTIFEHTLASAHIEVYKQGEYIFLHIWYEVHNSSQGGTQGECVGLTRRVLRHKRQRLLDTLDGGECVSIPSQGKEESVCPGLSAMTAFQRQHMCLVESTDLVNIDGIYTSAYSHAIGHKDFVFFNAHLLQDKSMKFIRVRNIGMTVDRNYHVAKVLTYDSTRDLAVAKLLSRSEIVEALVAIDGSTNLTRLAPSVHRFPSLDTKLMAEGAMGVALQGVKTIHYLPKSGVTVFGSVRERSVHQFRFRDQMSSRDLLEIVVGGEADVPVSQRGDCGAPIIVAMGANAGKLLGIHAVVIPDTNHWHISVITQEDLRAIEGYSADEQCAFVDEFESYIDRNGDVSDCPYGEMITPVGEFKFKTLPATRTDLSHWHKSPFSDEFEEQLVPGPLDPEDPIITADLPVNRQGRKSLLIGPNSKLGEKTTPIPADILAWIADQLTEEFTMKLKGSIKQLSDNPEDLLEGALNGYEGNKFVTGLEVNSAAGLPWSYLGGPLKSDWVSKDPDTQRRFFTSRGLQVRDRVLKKLKLGRQGKRLISFTNTKLKDTTIKKDKACSGKTRVFHCVPIDMILFESSLMGPFKEAFTAQMIECHHAIGVNPRSIHWDQIAQHLLKHPNFFDMDYVNFDVSTHGDILSTVYEIQRRVIQNLVPDNWDEARKICAQELINTFVVDVKTVYQKNKGNASGGFGTTPTNCLVNIINCIYAWIMLTGIYDLSVFWANMSIIVLGDDIVISVSDAFKHLINFLTFKEVLEVIGFNVTVGSKDGVEQAFTNFDQLQFLKRSFVYDEERSVYFGPLLQRSIESPFVWTTLRSEQHPIWKALVDEELLEASLHGEEYYNSFVNKLKKCRDTALLRYLCNSLLLTYKRAQVAYWQKYYDISSRGSIFPEQNLD
uniref:RNA-directed RNA polymerase n=1 Tax=Riboviria sp. TaxID=2585031 RepID=A0A8K1WRI0_9VIRU|nr:MAG: hypothetical protein 1 [Riboviria sp.]